MLGRVITAGVGGLGLAEPLLILLDGLALLAEIVVFDLLRARTRPGASSGFSSDGPGKAKAIDITMLRQNKPINTKGLMLLALTLAGPAVPPVAQLQLGKLAVGRPAERRLGHGLGRDEAGHLSLRWAGGRRGQFPSPSGSGPG